MKVFVLTTGTYSDYTIQGIYSSKEKAEEIANLMTRNKCYYDINDIEEWEVDSLTFNRFSYIVYYCIPTNKITYSLFNDVSFIEDTFEKYTQIFSFSIPYDKRLENNEELIRKIAYDRYAQYKAQQEGVV